MVAGRDRSRSITAPVPPNAKINTASAANPNRRCVRFSARCRVMNSPLVINMSAMEPNAAKLSDGGDKGNHQSQTLPRRSLERLVRRVELGVCRRKNTPPPGGGMTGPAAGKGRPKLATHHKGKPRPRSERGQTPPMKQTGTRVPSKTKQRGRAPNASKLSDSHWRSKTWMAEKT